MQLPNDFEDWLWIDALCIDQSSAWERMHQVGEMDKIFGGAKLVNAWLGIPESSSNEDIEWMQSLSYQDSIVSRLPLPEAIRYCGSLGDDEVLSDLYWKAYWKRLWVFQELCLAREVRLMCGNFIFSMRYFELSLANNMLDLTEARQVDLDTSWAAAMSGERCIPAAVMINHIQRLKRQRGGLCGVMRSARHLQCADLRDRVYAVLSVAA